MLFEPSAIVLYVDNMTISSGFYQNLLGIKAEEASPTFHSFKLSTGMNLGLKARNSVVPPTDQKSGSGELAFIADNNKMVDKLFVELQSNKINILSEPSALPFGYSFVALDPDGNRLRVVSLQKSS